MGINAHCVNHQTVPYYRSTKGKFLMCKSFDLITEHSSDECICYQEDGCLYRNGVSVCLDDVGDWYTPYCPACEPHCFQTPEYYRAVCEELAEGFEEPDVIKELLIEECERVRYDERTHKRVFTAYSLLGGA